MKREKWPIVRSMLTMAIVFLLSSAALQAQVTESKTVRKSFAVTKNAIVDIGNKYGDITVETWAKDSIAVEIQVRVTDKNREKMKAKMNAINFDLTQSGHYVVINTIIGDTKNLIFSEFNKIKESVGVSDSQVEIKMSIKLPDNLDLRITNKFGNVYIVDYKGEVTLNVSNGKLKANNFTGFVNLKISFGNAMINSIDSGTLEVYYSEMNLGSSKKLRITSKTSDITITEVSQLFVNSSRDDYRIRMISDFETESNWTDFSINEFSTRSAIKMTFGDLTIEKIKPTFENISIDARSTKINLFFDRNTDVNFDIVSNREISLPMEAKIDATEKINEKEKIMRYKGRTGNIAVGKPKLIMNSSSGEISILKR
jgi:uncharacterized protein (DUF2141 family)